ncbi:uncharacterized protein BCR38DRAFT_477839 [Pseudomassariella vexata]|uniref:Uncharacterized protein n=1 Tax=Pseudomassariella vexata TaxID=1141098 RepID=A0A1Y2DH00_9PEZI|nr:uncharacterized protein BCR38DRAFT_477839 [Pseudomassariella vexata]ORY58530.1 hypothetical protein BCR38DRAFT_477839 [Pseudomassariella vexata]
MSYSTMRTAVVQTTILAALTMIISHHIHQHAYDGVWEDEVFKNFTQTLALVDKNMTKSTSSFNGTSVTSDTSQLNSTSSVNGTFSAAFEVSKDEPSFYMVRLPRKMLVVALLCPLQYYWHIWLERSFPSRPKGVEIVNERERSEVDVIDDREERVVKKWIAQGKVRRSSLSWWNTFVKWILHVIIAHLWYGAVYHIAIGLSKLESPSSIFAIFAPFRLFLYWIGMMFSISPLASLVAFVIVPASRRTTFIEGADLLWTTFVGAFFRLVIPWMVKTTYAQDLMGNFTEGMMTSDEKMKKLRALDEL